MLVANRQIAKYGKPTFIIRPGGRRMPARSAFRMRRRRINVYFVYAPPLDDYAGPEFLDPSPDREAARWWAAHVLPVNPHDAERVLQLVERDQIRLEPAIPLVPPVQNPS